MPAKAKRPRDKSENESDPEPPPDPHRPLPVIKVVGISASGKSTLVRALRGTGYDARPVSQEHSSIPDLWQQFDRAAHLIYLHANLEAQQARRPDVSWTPAAYHEEIRRLAHAREHADLRIDTSGLSPQEVFKVAHAYLARQRVRHANQSLPALPATGSPRKPSPPDTA